MLEARYKLSLVCFEILWNYWEITYCTTQLVQQVCFNVSIILSVIFNTVAVTQHNFFFFQCFEAFLEVVLFYRVCPYLFGLFCSFFKNI